MSLFNHILFKECPLDDVFFDSLREDYPGFDKWYRDKSEENEKAYVYVDDGVQAFLYLKYEDNEPVGDLGAERRLKIGTLKICPDARGKRLGEGAMGIALWRWQQSDVDQIYVTVYPKHSTLIEMLSSFGFRYAGVKGQEHVYVKDKRTMEYSSPKESFPYMDPDFRMGRYLPVNDTYHDTLFQYSDLKNTQQNPEELAVSNGIIKDYIATPTSELDYAPGDLVFIFRVHTGDERKTYRSALTSYCTITRSIPIKIKGMPVKTLTEFKKIVGNKTVYSVKELEEKYQRHANVYVLEMTYNGYFGAGHNIIHKELADMGLFEQHPYLQKLSRENVFEIMERGGKNVQDIVVYKSRTRK